MRRCPHPVCFNFYVPSLFWFSIVGSVLFLRTKHLEFLQRIFGYGSQILKVLSQKELVPIWKLE